MYFSVYACMNHIHVLILKSRTLERNPLRLCSECQKNDLIKCHRPWICICMCFCRIDEMHDAVLLLTKEVDNTVEEDEVNVLCLLSVLFYIKVSIHRTCPVRNETVPFLSEGIVLGWVKKSPIFWCHCIVFKIIARIRSNCENILICENAVNFWRQRIYLGLCTSK